MSDARRLLPLDAIQDGVVILDAERGIVDVNESFCALVGFPRAELLGRRPPYPYWPPGDTAELEAAFRAVATGRRRDVELRYRRRDGAHVDVMLAGSVLGAHGQRADGYVATVKDVSERRRAERAQAALRRVATAVAAGATPEQVFERVAEEVAAALEAASGAVVRYESAQEGAVVGRVGIDVPVPWRFPLSGPNTTAQTARSGEPSRVDDFAEIDDDVARRLVAGGQRSSVAVPVRVGEELWGALTVGNGRPRAFAADAETMLGRMAELLGLALAAADARGRLEARALTDGLTGLLDHRSFQDRLRVELERARRHDRPLAVAVFDVDDFKPINETRGHGAGDAVLRVVAQALADGGRSSEVAARLGGDEFAVLAPETDAAGALSLAARVRERASAGSRALGLPVTLSAGVCSLADAEDGDLLQRADRALYWAKAHGRDRAAAYAPDVTDGLSHRDRTARLERERAFAGLRALARGMDVPADGAPTRCERVAGLAHAIAAVLGWQGDRLRRIREAALLHDVGWAAVEDGDAEGAHCRLGARLVRGVLDDEQAAWIRGHHERPDGGGFPDGLRGEQLPLGAAILATAVAFDAFRASAAGHDGNGDRAALAACRRLAGSALDSRAADALEPALAALRGGGQELAPA